MAAPLGEGSRRGCPAPGTLEQRLGSVFRVMPVPYSPALERQHEVAFRAFARALAQRSATDVRSEVERRAEGALTTGEVKLFVAESLLLDLLQQGWQVVQTEPGLIIGPPDDRSRDRGQIKERIRNAHLIERNIYLRQRPVRDFVTAMEQSRLTATGWHSIFSLMRDGQALADQLYEAKSVEALAQLIAPYVQFVEAGSMCEHTGLALSDVWRYFRLTWVNAPKSVPGRSMMILIRDAAAPGHPVIGIAALGSSVVQQQIRDQWIGWDAQSFVKRLRSMPSSRLGRWLLKSVSEQIDSIYVDDLLADGLVTKREISFPTGECIERLRETGEEAKQEHQLYPGRLAHKRSEGSWLAATRRPLFRSKRCDTLAKLLGIRRAFRSIGLASGTRAEIVAAADKPEFV